MQIKKITFSVRHTFHRITKSTSRQFDEYFFFLQEKKKSIKDSGCFWQGSYEVVLVSCIFSNPYNHELPQLKCLSIRGSCLTLWQLVLKVCSLQYTSAVNYINKWQTNVKKGLTDKQFLLMAIFSGTVD